MTAFAAPPGPGRKWSAPLVLVERALPGLGLALQVGKDGLEPPNMAAAAGVTFDFTVRLGTPRSDGSRIVNLGAGRDPGALPLERRCP